MRAGYFFFFFFFFFFLNVGPPKEDIFSDHLLWSVFQSTLHIYFTDYNFNFCGSLRAAFMYCFNSSVLWHIVDTSFIACTSCIILCCISYSMSDNHPWCPDWGPTSWSPLFLWWLSMDDVGLQVRHLVREATVNIRRIFQVVPCDLEQPQGFADICEVGLTTGLTENLPSLLDTGLPPEWSWHQPPYKRSMDTDMWCLPMDTDPFHSLLMVWQPTTEIICSQLQDYSW